MPVINYASQRGFKVARYGRVINGLEWGFWIFVLLYSTGAIFPIWLMGKQTLANVGDIISGNTAATLQLIWAVIYVFFVLIALTRLNDLYEVLKAHPVILIVLPLVMLASAAYAATPALSIQRSVTTIIGTFMGMYLGVRYSIRDIIKLMCTALTIAMVSSAFVMLFMHNLGVMEVAVPGAWSGSFLHKNSLGHLGLLSLLFYGYFYTAGKGYQKLPWVGLIVMVLWLMLGAKSTTSDIGIFLMLGAAFILRSLSRSSEDFTLVLLAAIVVIASAFPLLTLLYTQVLELIGKDATLTGRTELWALTFESFLQRPFIGWGYDNFWEGTEPYGGLSIRSQLHWMVPHAHNSWLELALQIGIVGLVIYARMLFGTMHRGLVLARTTLKPEYALAIIFVCYLLMFSVGERVFLLRNDIRHILLVAFFVVMWRDLRFHNLDLVTKLPLRLRPKDRRRHAVTG